MPMEGERLSTFMSAVQAGDLSAVEGLLKTGADPNEEGWVRDGGGYYTMPALVCAVWKGHAAIAKALLAHGADPNASHRFGREDDDCPLRYPLGLAIDQRDIDLIKTLLDAGARVAFEPVEWLGPPMDALTYAVERAYDERVIAYLKARFRGPERRPLTP